MCFGLILFHAVWTFNIVSTSSCNFLVEVHVEFIYHSCQVLLSKLYLWVRPHWKQKVHIKMSVSHEIQYIIWVPPSKLFILKHTNNNEKKTTQRAIFGNCCYKLFGHSLEPCLRLLELSMTSRHQINSNVLTVWSVSAKKAHKEWGVTLHYKISPCLLQRWTREKKKSSQIPDGGRSRKHFVIYLVQLKLGRRFSSGRRLNMQNAVGKVHTQGMLSGWARPVLIHLYLLPSRTQKWLQIVETDKAGKNGDWIMSDSSRWIKEEVRRTPHEDFSCLFHNAALR